MVDQGLGNPMLKIWSGATPQLATSGQRDKIRKALKQKTSIKHRSNTSQIHFIHSLKYQTVLGLPWLQWHNLTIDLESKDMTTWQLFYISCSSTSKESPESSQEVMIPLCYADLNEIFSKRRTTKLSPNCACDCAIKLLDGTTPPCNCIYPLSCKGHGVYPVGSLMGINPSSPQWNKATLSWIIRSPLFISVLILIAYLPCHGLPSHSARVPRIAYGSTK